MNPVEPGATPAQAAPAEEAEEAEEAAEAGASIDIHKLADKVYRLMLKDVRLARARGAGIRQRGRGDRR
jgi:hypothetical protein